MLQLYQKSSYIDKFTIYGERHSGTNFIEKCFKQTFGLDITYYYGFKHFFGFTKPETIKYHAKYPVLFIGMVRNPYQWLQAFYNMAHHVPQQTRYNFNNFLTNEWYSIDNNGNEIMTDRNYLTQPNPIRYKNIFELRKIKNQYLIETMPCIADNYLLLSYDLFIQNHLNYLKIIKDRFFLKQIDNPPDIIQKSRLYLAGEFKDIIDNNIDWTIESQLGYFKDQF